MTACWTSLLVCALVSPRTVQISLLQVALQDPVPVRHEERARRRETRFPRAAGGSPPRAWRAGCRSGHRRGCAFPPSPRRTAGPRARRFPWARDARDRLDEAAVRGEAHHAGVAPVGHPQVPPAVEGHVLRAQEETVGRCPVRPNVAIFSPRALHCAMRFAPYSETKKVPSSASTTS